MSEKKLGTAPAIITRRRFIRFASAGLAVPFLSNQAEAATFFMKRFLARPPKKTPFITSNDDFYIVQYSGPQTVNMKNWSLQIVGKLRKPITLTYDDIRARPVVEQMVTLTCIDNVVAGEQMSNAVWKGISLRALLEEVEPLSSAQDLALFGDDDYSDSFPVNRGMEYDVMLAYEMNGVPLNKNHGFPLRAIVPGIYGIKNVKWLTKIELTDYDYKGYWQKKSWTDRGTIKVSSRIDDPGPYSTLADGYVLRGLAFSGYNSIGLVELSFDGGEKWIPAELEKTPSPYSWVFWHYVWKNPKSGSYQITVRATDKIGRTQSNFIARAFPDGTSGLHSVFAFVD